jgi:hypothetical protein
MTKAKDDKALSSINEIPAEHIKVISAWLLNFRERRRDGDDVEFIDGYNAGLEEAASALNYAEGKDEDTH